MRNVLPPRPADVLVPCAAIADFGWWCFFPGDPLLVGREEAEARVVCLVELDLSGLRLCAEAPVVTGRVRVCAEAPVVTGRVRVCAEAPVVTGRVRVCRLSLSSRDVQLSLELVLCWSISAGEVVCSISAGEVVCSISAGQQS